MLTKISQLSEKLYSKWKRIKILFCKCCVCVQDKFYMESKFLVFLLIWKTNSSSDKNVSVLDQVYNFFKIWSFTQWSTSLVGLVVLYWISGYYYNKKLSEKGGWLDSKTRILLIAFDLLVNFGLGLYCMYHRETILGMFMITCPIAISPVIFVLELICYYVYNRYELWQFFYKKKQKK